MPGVFKNTLRFIVRTFLGVGEFVESKFLKEIIEGFFRQVEWAIILTAIIGLGFKINNDVIVVFGLLLSLCFFLYSISFWVDSAHEFFKISVVETNKRYLDLGLPTYSRFSTDICFVFIIIFMNGFMISSIYYGIIAVVNL